MSAYKFGKAMPFKCVMHGIRWVGSWSVFSLFSFLSFSCKKPRLWTSRAGWKKLAHKHTSLFSGLAQTLTTQLSSNSDLECAQACLHLHVSPVSRTADQTRRDIITTGREAGSTEVCVSRGGLLHIRPLMTDIKTNTLAHTQTHATLYTVSLCCVWMCFNVFVFDMNQWSLAVCVCVQTLSFDKRAALTSSLASRW